MKKLLLLCFVFIVNTNISVAYLIMGPMLGHCDAEKALIWCALDEKSSIEVEISEDKNFKNSRIIKRADFHVGAIEVNQLKAETVYYYRIHFPYRNKTLKNRHLQTDVFSFKSAPLQGQHGKLRFLFSSC